MTSLVRYEAARAALQAAHDVDEVKGIRDKAQAMAAYAKQAKDTALVEWATEIKVRAERKAGEMLADIERHQGKRSDRTSDHDGPKSLKDILEENEIAPTTAKRWQKLADVPEDKFEQAVAAAKEVAGEVTTAALLRSAKTSDHDGQKSTAKAAKAAMAAPKEIGKLQAETERLQAALTETDEKREAAAEEARELRDRLTMFEATEPDEQQKMIATLQKLVQRKDAEIARQRGQISDLNNKCNALIRQVKSLQKQAA